MNLIYFKTHNDIISIVVSTLLAVLIVVLAIWVYNLNIEKDKAHDTWYNAWKNGIANATDCQWLTSGYYDHPDSELQPLLKQRIGELKCPL